MNWLKKLFRKEAYVGSFQLKIQGDMWVYVHCFESKRGKRRTEVINCDVYPGTGWKKAYERTELYQLRIRPWEEWGKKDSGIYTYGQVKNPKEEFLAVLKGEAKWKIDHDHSG